MTDTTTISKIPPVTEVSKSPFYYVKKRLLNNKPAMAGLILIIISIVLALLGYLIMPDNTPNANDSAPQIKKRPPIFRVKLLKERRNQEVKKVDFFTKLINGQESEYSITPIVSYRIDENKMIAYIRMFGDETIEQKRSIVDALLPLYIGRSFKIESGEGLGNYEINGDMVTYLDINEQAMKMSKKDMIEHFKKQCIEERTYWLGTDMQGRDMLSRLLFGIRISLSIGLISVLISFFVGLTLGSMAGFFGGKVDAFIMWIMTVVWSIPSIMLVIAISLALGSRGIWVAFVAVGLTTWVEISRVVRGQILGVKQKLFVEAARSLGISNRRIIINHILPNILGPLIVIMASNFASAILTEAGLSFLGLGVQPPMPSWGSMINEGFAVIGSSDSFHLIFYPSLSICLLVLAFNLFGNGLRDAYDPTTKK